MMKDKSLVFQFVVVAMLNGLIFQAALMGAEQPDDVENRSIAEIVHFMTRTRPRKASLARIVSKADTEPAFRKDLVNALTERLSEVTANIQISNTVRSLRDLNAREVLPELREIWSETEKRTYGLEFGDLRIQLLITISEFLPEAERIEFLIDTESDKTEAPIVRFRATILLCATGEKRAIEHVLSVYEQRKQQFPLTTRMSLEDQNGYIRRMKEQEANRHAWDSDGDLMSSYIETGLLLDPDNTDTDGDGLLDGNDRNPLCKPQKGELSEDQLIAHFILYLHAQYYCMSRSPFDFKLVIVQPVDPWDGKGNQSLFDGMQFKGIDGLILQMDKGQIERFRALHRPGTSVIGIHKNPEDKDRKDVKTFHLSISGGPGEHRTYNITFKRINNVWLPTFWQLGMIT